MENLDRGLNAMPGRDGGVYLSWRLLPQDTHTVTFHVYRSDDHSDLPAKLTAQPIAKTTDFADSKARRGVNYVYTVVPVVDGRETAGEIQTSITPGADTSRCRIIKLQGDYTARMATVADLDGDGQLEFIIKQPDFNADPYQRPGYWKPSQDTYKIEAYKQDGSMMWRYDMGWAIEEGTWYSPILVYDMDGDGKAEVYCKAGEGDPRNEAGLVETGPEWLVKLDGRSGQIAAKAPWPSREGFEDYNRYCRNFLSVAYLDGKNPVLIVERGTYGLIKILALDGALQPIWRWEASGECQGYRGQGAHKIQPADIDDDGRDEVIFGSACLDDNGKPLWNAGLGHPDCMFVNDMDPMRPGLKIYYGLEKKRDKNAVCLVDARTGQLIWGYEGPTKHVHGKGMAGDIDPRHAGIEFHAAEKDGTNCWLYAASGKLINQDKMGGTSPHCLWWDADPQKELLINKTISDFAGPEIDSIEGQILAIGDFLGDWREEIITSIPGELRIYSTNIPATSRRVCLLKDRQYRVGVASSTSGYYFEPQMGSIPLEM